MAIRGNRVIPNAHFHKDWQRYIKTWFDQPARKKRRNQKRVEKAKRIAPRPLKKLRPVVRCPTIRFNMRQRAGRGFTLEELKAAGISPKVAQTIGIAVDKRRKNRSVESLQQNVHRIKEYRSKLILFPLRGKKAKKGEASEQEMRLAKQINGDVLPIKSGKASGPKVKIARKVTKAEAKFSAFHAARQARVNKKLAPGRAKRARDAEAEAKEKAKS